MNRLQRAAWVARELERLYPETPVPLDHRDPFTLLVAVVLSAQCTDVRVNLTTPALFARASTPDALAALPLAELEAIIRPCGLAPAKSRHLQATARLLLERHGGQVPATLEELEALPGVGHKTAQVVLAQAFGQPAFPVDTHIHRLARRWRLSSGRNVLQTERDLKRLYPASSWNPLHLRIIFFGREHCTARTPCDASSRACPFCPVLNPPRGRTAPDPATSPKNSGPPPAEKRSARQH